MKPRPKIQLRPKAPAVKPQTLSVDLIRDRLNALRGQFYAGQPAWFQKQRPMLIQALTYPALWLATRGMTTEMPEDDYKQMIDSIIRDAKGNMTAEPRSPAHYFLAVVQRHMSHHGEEYYDACRLIRNTVAQATAALPAHRQPDNTLGNLAALHALTRSQGGRKKQPALDSQLPLF